MKERLVRDTFKDQDIIVLLSDPIYRMLEQTELKVNSYGYVMIEWA